VKPLTKIQASAKGEDCTLRVSGYGGCASTETTVLCHSPCNDKGTAFKSPDWWAAYGCFSCHEIMDRRHRPQWLSPDEKNDVWLRGIYETNKILREKGLIN